MEAYSSEASLNRLPPARGDFPDTADIVNCTVSLKSLKRCLTIDSCLKGVR